MHSFTGLSEILLKMGPMKATHLISPLVTNKHDEGPVVLLDIVID